MIGLIVIVTCILCGLSYAAGFQAGQEYEWKCLVRKSLENDVQRLKRIKK